MRKKEIENRLVRIEEALSQQSIHFNDALLKYSETLGKYSHRIKFLEEEVFDCPACRDIGAIHFCSLCGRKWNLGKKVPRPKVVK